MNNFGEKLTLGGVGRLKPADEIKLADECVRRHGHDMRDCMHACDPCTERFGIADTPVSDAMDVHEPAMEQEDPLATDIDVGVSVSDDELDQVIEP